MYKVREIELGDIFPIIRILKKIDIKSLASEVSKDIAVEDKTAEEKKKIAEEQAIELVLQILLKMDEAEEDILLVLSGWAGCSKDEAKHIKLSDLETLVPEFLEKNPISKMKELFTLAARRVK